jgi:hypothetical protein
MTIPINENTRVGLLRGLVAEAIATDKRAWNAAERALRDPAGWQELRDAGLLTELPGGYCGLTPRAVRLVLK